MKKLALAALMSLCTAHVAFAADAAPPAADCQAKAIGKNGKPLAGAAKDSFIKKCEADAKGPSASGCEEKAIGKNGRPLAGAAKTNFMKKCEADAKK